MGHNLWQARVDTVYVVELLIAAHRGNPTRAFGLSEPASLKHSEQCKRVTIFYSLIVLFSRSNPLRKAGLLHVGPAVADLGTHHFFPLRKNH